MSKSPELSLQPLGILDVQPLDVFALPEQPPGLPVVDSRPFEPGNEFALTPDVPLAFQHMPVRLGQVLADRRPIHT